MLMSCWYRSGAAFLSACYNLPQTFPFSPTKGEPIGKLCPVTPSSQQMLITLLITCFTTALLRLTELNFRICYQRVMKAGHCASIWRRIGTAVEILCAAICGFQPASSTKSLSLSLHTHLCCVAPTEHGSPVEQKPQGEPRSLCCPWETACVFLFLRQERRQSLG